jgi:beta-galactosidase
VVCAKAEKYNKKVEYSKAGFFEVANSGRGVSGFNVGWRFYKGNVEGASNKKFDDSSWSVINCPHGLEYLPDNAGGNVNYQGIAWYRKKFTLNNDYKNKVNTLHFEAVMGKCKVYVNGELAKEHFGGYLPFEVNLNEYIKFGEENIIAVMADNSDDSSYPPGKPQSQLDFSYFGGIYRDVWLVTTNKLYITNPNTANQVAGGGVLSYIELLSNNNINLNLKINLNNTASVRTKGKVVVVVQDELGVVVAKGKTAYSVGANTNANVTTKVLVKKPKLWTPWSPDLYTIKIYVNDIRNQNLDAVALKQGLRKIEFKGVEGFWLNGKKYPGKLIGGNRHQDYGTVGNALPNSGQWRDAILLKKAGFDVVRTGHYPADPSFLDACDALGIFVIEPTPGWQFWNNDDIFVNRVYDDVANLVRRDRNRTCMLLYEPILNETHYPNSFAKEVHEIVHREYPYQGIFTAADSHITGKEYFDVLFAHPFAGTYGKLLGKSFFTREWGDNVDAWTSNNSTSRVLREWGEQAQLIQAKHYGDPAYDFSSLEKFANQPDQFVGGTMWHSFDHNRGCFTIPFYGGIMDFFRLPKYSNYLFASQRDVKQGYEPMIYIAHEISQVSGPDMTVYTNCEEVRLIKYKRDTLYCKVADLNKKMHGPIVTFKDVFNFQELKSLTRAAKWDQACFIAEGLIDGKVVVREVKTPSYKPSKIVLEVKNEGIDLVANGSDLIQVVAYVTDHMGNVKRLDDHYIEFKVYGEGQQIAPNIVSINPRKTQWGTAPVLIRSTLKSGQITVKASVLNKASGTVVPAQITFNSVANKDKMVYTEVGTENVDKIVQGKDLSKDELYLKLRQVQNELNRYKMEKVGKQQQEMEGFRK